MARGGRHFVPLGLSLLVSGLLSGDHEILRPVVESMYQ
jgi:hypothetical protein